MNTSQWLALISAAAPSFKWRLEKGRIRNSEGHCPICAALFWVSEGGVDWYTAAYSAANQAGLPNFNPDLMVIDRIIKAADRETSSPLRQDLLQAVGLVGHPIHQTFKVSPCA